MAAYVKPVVFKLAGQMYGVDINLVIGIEKQLNIVPVPNSIAYVKGIINLRGQVIPVYSLKKKFGMSDTAALETMIVINVSGVMIALEVDDVMEIDDINPEKIVPMPMIAKSQDSQYLDRVANLDNRLIILLDVNALLTDAEAESVKQLTEDMQK